MQYRGLVLGWYHQRNAGDDRLAHCIERWLHDHELLFLSHTETPPGDVLEQCDYVILGGGSIANAHHGAFSGMHKWIADAKLPVFGVGLTVSSLPALREEFKAIPASGGLVWVRDRESADFLGLPEDQCVAAPDLSWLFPLEQDHFSQGEVTRSNIAINFRPWPMRSWDPKAWREPIAALQNTVPYPLCFGRDDDRQVLCEVFGSRAQMFRALQKDGEFDPTLAARSELVIAMRFHAILFAIQSNTPFVALGNSRKLQWMLDGLNLGEFVVPVEEPQGLGEVMEAALKMDPQRLKDITAHQKKLAWEVANTFRERIESQAENSRTRRLRRRESPSISTRIKRRLLSS